MPVALVRYARSGRFRPSTSWRVAWLCQSEVPDCAADQGSHPGGLPSRAPDEHLVNRSVGEHISRVFQVYGAAIKYRYGRSRFGAKRPYEGCTDGRSEEHTSELQSPMY